MAEETPAKDSIQVYSESAAELDTQLDKPTFESVAEPSFSCDLRRSDALCLRRRAVL